MIADAGSIKMAIFYFGSQDSVPVSINNLVRCVAVISFAVALSPSNASMYSSGSVAARSATCFNTIRYLIQMHSVTGPSDVTHAEGSKTSYSK